MTGQTSIQIFTKPNCSHCHDAKAALRQLGLAFTEHSVEKQTTADTAIALSGRATVPQIFAGPYHIGGSDELADLIRAGLLHPILSGLNGAPAPAIPPAAGGRDMLFTQIIPPSDGARDPDPEAWPILHFYKSFFGFWPNTFAYLHHWPEAYKLFVYCHNFAAIRSAKEVLGLRLMAAVGFATSNAQGCSYCQAHTAAWGGDDSGNVVRQALSQSEAQPGDERARFEKALTLLAARAARNTVSDGVVENIHRTGKALDLSPDRIEAHIDATAMIVAALGFLNIFNDLVGVEVEGDWAVSARNVGVELGRHGAGAKNPDNLSYALPEGGPTLEDMLHKYAGQVGDPEAYLSSALGAVPGWIAHWPKETAVFHARLYAGLMAGDAAFSTEQKHLFARTFALAKGAGSQAAEEAAFALHAGKSPARTAARAKACIGVATGRSLPGDLFDDREVAALKIVWLAAQIPLITPQAWIAPAADLFTPEDLIHLFTICGLTSLIQRFGAIRPFDVAAATAARLTEHGIPRDALAARYPIPATVEEV